MKKYPYLLTVIILITAYLFTAHAEKKPLDHSVYDSWKSVQKYQISYNGKWIAYELNPQLGDSCLIYLNSSASVEDTIQRGNGVVFSPYSDFLVCMIKPFRDTIRQMKLDKKKPDQMPKDTLAVKVFKLDSLIKIPEVKSFKIAEENSRWLVCHMEKENKKKDTTSVDSTKIDSTITESPEEKKDSTETKKKKIQQDGTPLLVFNPIKNLEYKFENVVSYSVAKKSHMIGFIATVKDSVDSVLVDSVKVCVYDPDKDKLKVLFNGPGFAKKLTLEDMGTQAAYLFSTDTGKAKVYSLYYYKEGGSGGTGIVDTLTKGMPEGWTVSNNGELDFSDDGTKLFMGTALKPEPEPKDTLLDDEKVKVDVWSWKDSRLQPQQLKELGKDKKRTYTAVWHTNTKKFVQLGNEDIMTVRKIQKGNGNVALGINEQPYYRNITWEWPSFADYYLVDVNNGKQELILKKHQFSVSLSPAGKFLIYYNNPDSSWFSYDIQNRKHVSLTKKLPVNFYDEEHDVPEPVGPYGIAGWSQNDGSVYIFDRFDVWKIDPAGKAEAKNITNGFGRENNTRFRYVKLDKEEEFIDIENDIMLSAFNKVTKQAGYYYANFEQAGDPKKLTLGDFMFNDIMKAKEAEKLIWKRGSYYDYPDLYYSNMDFKKAKKLTDGNPQQKEYMWGTVELIKWNDLEGNEVQGLLYKPDNFDPNKKYPLMVYFYEKYTDLLNRHYIPKPTASIIYPNLYASNGYIVFIPDIHYKTGNPGNDAYNSIMSGTMHLIGQGFVNKEKMGLQGQSWGGYQTAYLVTRTPMFAAAMAGAPVSNMTSAYGGIRWGSGLCRAFQYEVGQSRIGGTLWEKPELYIENSPLFYADRVETPLLIMHNDEDGAVPWYQGIEYFNALRRLDKPVWLLNYNGDAHNLMKRPNRVDLSIRMMQFFDYYLRDKPAPKWLEKGIPALDKGKDNGLELIEK